MSSDNHAEPEHAACLAVVIPVFNEIGTIQGLVRRVLAQAAVTEVLVVDDASTDGSGEALVPLTLRDRRLRILRHSRNLGKGAAIRTARASMSAPFIVIQDGDMEYDPMDYSRMLGSLRDNSADVVYGSRFLHGRSSSRFHQVINYWLTKLANWVNGTRLTDVHTGLKMFKSSVFKEVVLEEDRFGFCPEVTAKLARIPTVRIVEVPIRYRPRGRVEGKKIRVRDGFRAIYCNLKYGLMRKAIAQLRGRVPSASVLSMRQQRTEESCRLHSGSQKVRPKSTEGYEANVCLESDNGDSGM